MNVQRGKTSESICSLDLGRAFLSRTKHRNHIRKDEKSHKYKKLPCKKRKPFAIRVTKGLFPKSLYKPIRKKSSTMEKWIVHTKKYSHWKNAKSHI